MVSWNTESRDYEASDADHLGGIYDGRGGISYCVRKSEGDDAACFGDRAEASDGRGEKIFGFPVGM